MNRLTLDLHVSEFRVLITYLRKATDGQEQLPLASRSLAMMVLVSYTNTWRAHRLIAWKNRNPKRAYKLSLPLVVAKALHAEMQYSLLNDREQALLNLLDQAVINYRNPHTEPFVIGDLVVTGHR